MWLSCVINMDGEVLTWKTQLLCTSQPSCEVNKSSSCFFCQCAVHYMNTRTLAQTLQVSLSHVDVTSLTNARFHRFSVTVFSLQMFCLRQPLDGNVHTDVFKSHRCICSWFEKKLPDESSLQSICFKAEVNVQKLTDNRKYRKYNTFIYI